MYERLKVYLERKGLTLNTAKTRVLDVRQQSLQFLGFTIRWPTVTTVLRLRLPSSVVRLSAFALLRAASHYGTFEGDRA